MPNLSLSEIANDGKEYRSIMLVEKVFEKNGRQNTFQTDGGMFTASGLVIGNETITTTTDVESVAAKIIGLKAFTSRNLKKVELIGKYGGSSLQNRVPITQVLKSEEFGGQPAGGKRVNKGILFESDFSERLGEAENGMPVNGKYANAACHIIEACSNKVGAAFTGFKEEGGRNQSRPLAAQGDNLIIAPSAHQQHGAKLTDLTLLHGTSKVSYLSLKFGGTLTFMNAGVKETFVEREMKEEKLVNPLAKKIISNFGLDEATFCRVFNDYNKGTKHPTGVKANVNKAKLKTFLQTAIGSNYWMVHGHPDNSIDFWYMSPEMNPQYATIAGDVIVNYGGSGGKGKRVDITFSNSYFDFTVNIRNKQSGLYPSHIMCDYKSKAGIKKTTLR